MTVPCRHTPQEKRCLFPDCSAPLLLGEGGGGTRLNKLFSRRGLLATSWGLPTAVRPDTLRHCTRRGYASRWTTTGGELVPSYPDALLNPAPLIRCRSGKGRKLYAQYRELKGRATLKADSRGGGFQGERPPERILLTFGEGARLG